MGWGFILPYYTSNILQVKNIKFIIILLFFTLIFQSTLRPDDISDFEIEGISIGDSLLDYLSQNQIENKKYPVVRGGKEFKQYSKVPLDSKSEIYNRILLYYKTGDSRHIIKGIVGRIYYNNNINECYDLQKKIVNELESIFSDGKKIDRGKIKNLAYPEGDSYKNDISFYFKDGSMAHTACYDYSVKDTQSEDRLSVGIYSKEYFDWFLSIK